MFKKGVCILIVFAFGMTGVIPPCAYAQNIFPTPPHILSLTPAFHPVMIQGMRVHPENPLQFDFIVDTGDTSVDVNGIQFRRETTKLFKYFLASMTVPEKEMWVNLSPYEKDRIIANGLGQTELGRDMLSQDYILKQLTSSLIYPDSRTGKSFWEKVYTRARRAFGTSDIPINTFNKVWIVPDKAVVYEHGNTVYITESHLKVMLEEDYLSMQRHSTALRAGADGGKARGSLDAHSLGANIVREIVLPELEKEVNTGKNFANLRQIYNAMILAVWFKANLQKSLLGQVYADKNKIKGVDAMDKSFRKKIYDQYLQSFKKGVYNYIREENDPTTGEVIPRKYFSGGVVGLDAAVLHVVKGPVVPSAVEDNQVGKRVEVDSAMLDVGPPALPLRPDIQITNRVGDLVSLLVRYVSERVAAHIAMKGPEIIVAMPAKNTQNAFRFIADENVQWKAENPQPVVEGNHRGIKLDLNSDKESITLKKSNFLFNDVISLRMELYHGLGTSRMEKELMEYIFTKLSQEDRDELEAKIGVPLTEIIVPKFKVQKRSDGSHLIVVTKTTFDGRHHYRLTIEVPDDFDVEESGDEIKIKGKRPVEVQMKATTDFEPLTFLPTDQILNKQAREEMETNPDYKETAEGLVYLSFKEKVLGGSPWYLAHFSRDSIIGAIFNWPALTQQAKETYVRSSYDRMNQDGTATVNDEDFQERYFWLEVTEAFYKLRVKREEEHKEVKPEELMYMWRKVLDNPNRGELRYKVLDGTLLLPGLEELLFNDLDDEELTRFLKQTNGRNYMAETNIVTALRNFNRILELTHGYTQAVNELLMRHPEFNGDVRKLVRLPEFQGLAQQLIKKVPGFDLGWRDSPVGYGLNGVYAFEINALALIAIKKMTAMIERVEHLGMDVQQLAEDNNLRMLSHYLKKQDGIGLAEAREAWSTSTEHFKVHISKGEVAAKISGYLGRSTVPESKKKFLRNSIIGRDKGGKPITVDNFLKGRATPPWLENGFSFMDLALDKDGLPQRIMTSDVSYFLLLDDLESRDLNNILDAISMPRPFGMWVNNVGAAIVNAVFSDDEEIKALFDREGEYHGHEAFWSKLAGELATGTIRQMRYAKRGGERRQKDIARMEEVLVEMATIELTVGDSRNAEIWSAEYRENGPQPKDYEQTNGQSPPKPQHWGTTALWLTPEWKKAMEVARERLMRNWKAQVERHSNIIFGTDAPAYHFFIDGKIVTVRGLDELSKVSPPVLTDLIQRRVGFRRFVGRRWVRDGSNGSSPLTPAVANMIDRVPDGTRLQLLIHEMMAVKSGGAANRIDAAMTTPGGIDLNSSMLNLQTKRDGKSTAFDTAADSAMQVNGLAPVIIRITPMNSPLFSDSR